MHFSINGKELFALGVFISFLFLCWDGALYLCQTKWSCVLSVQKFQMQLADAKSFWKFAQYSEVLLKL